MTDHSVMTISGIVWSRADLVIAFVRTALKPMTTGKRPAYNLPRLFVFPVQRTDICFAGWLTGTQREGLDFLLIKNVF